MESPDGADYPAAFLKPWEREEPMEYEFNVTLAMPFDAAITRVKEALAAEKLGIVSEVDVQAVFKAKIDKDIAPYRILGACNPKLADRVIAAEPNAGVLLPCNLVVRSVDATQTVVSFMDPVAMLDASATAEPKAVAAEARGMLQRVARQLSG